MAEAVDFATFWLELCFITMVFIGSIALLWEHLREPWRGWRARRKGGLNHGTTRHAR